MAYEEITTMDMSLGPISLIRYVNNITDGLFMTFIIGFLYIVIVMGMYYAQKRQSGDGKPAVCMAVGGYAMSIAVFILGMIPGMINGIIVTEVIIMATVGTFWLFFAKKHNL